MSQERTPPPNHDSPFPAELPRDLQEAYALVHEATECAWELRRTAQILVEECGDLPIPDDQAKEVARLVSVLRKQLPSASRAFRMVEIELRAASAGSTCAHKDALDFSVQMKSLWDGKSIKRADIQRAWVLRSGVMLAVPPFDLDTAIERMKGEVAKVAENRGLSGPSRTEVGETNQETYDWTIEDALEKYPLLGNRDSAPVSLGGHPKDSEWLGPFWRSKIYPRGREDGDNCDAILQWLRFEVEWWEHRIQNAPWHAAREHGYKPWDITYVMRDTYRLVKHLQARGNWTHPPVEPAREFRNWVRDLEVLVQELKRVDHWVEHGRIETTGPPPDELLAELSKTERKLFEFLWKKPIAKLSELHAKVWTGKAVQDDAIKQAAGRLHNRLVALRSKISVSVTGEYVKLTRPDKNDK